MASTPERVARIELAPSPWKGDVLPLNHTREPLTSRLYHDLQVEWFIFDEQPARSKGRQQEEASRE